MYTVSLIRVMDNTSRAPLPDGHTQSVDDQLGAQVGGHRPADDASAPCVHDHCQVERSGPGSYVGDICNPQLIRSLGGEITLHQIGCWPLALGSPGGYIVLSAADPSQVGGFHQTSHPLAAHPDPCPCQGSGNAGSTIGLSGQVVQLTDPFGQGGIFLSTLGERPFQPGIVTTPGDFQYSAFALNGVAGLIRLYEPEDFGGTLSVSWANQAAAFFKISRSCRSLLFSRRNRASSCFSSVVSPSWR